MGTWPLPPPPPPPAAPTMYWTTAEHRQKEIGVILQYTVPAETYLTGETVPLNVEAPVGLVTIEGDYSHVWERAVGSGQMSEYNQARGSVGLGPHLANVIGADIRLGGSYAQDTFDLSLGIYGELGPVEGSLALPPQGNLQLNLPGGSALRGGFKLQSARDVFFLTTQEYLDSAGGPVAFGEQYAKGAGFTDMAFVFGSWSRGKWATGLENARLILRLAQYETGGWPFYREVP